MSAWRPNHGHKTPLDKSHCGEPFFIAAWGGECVNRSSIKQRARSQKIDSMLGGIVQAFVFIPFKHRIIWTLFVSIVKKKAGGCRGRHVHHRGDATGSGTPPLAKCRGLDASGVLDVNHLRTACFSSRQGKPTGRRLHLAPDHFQGCGGGCGFVLWVVLRDGLGCDGVSCLVRSGSRARGSRVNP